MAIKVNHADLVDVGWQPDADPWLGRAIGKAFLDEYFDAGKPHAVEGTTYRFSGAGGCTRRQAFYFAGTPESNPPDEASAWRMALGTIIHEAVQKVLTKAFPGCVCEAKVRDIELDGSGHIDVVITDESRRNADGKPYVICVEIKTVNGFKFKLGASTFKGAPEGPSLEHCIQAALAGAAMDADEVIVLWLAMELIGPDLVKYSADPVYGRFSAQWTLNRTEYLELVAAERKRVAWIRREMAANDNDPFAVTPFVADDDHKQRELIPGKSMTVAGERTWHCNYCNYRDTCLAGAAGE